MIFVGADGVRFNRDIIQRMLLSQLSMYMTLSTRVILHDLSLDCVDTERFIVDCRSWCGVCSRSHFSSFYCASPYFCAVRSFERNWIPVLIHHCRNDEEEEEYRDLLLKALPFIHASHLLFNSTVEGRIHIVRQLSPNLVIDSARSMFCSAFLRLIVFNSIKSSHFTIATAHLGAHLLLSRPLRRRIWWKSI
jgi:hypothetical protein